MIRPGCIDDIVRKHIRSTGAEIVQCDIMDLDGLSRLMMDYRIDIVYHLAAINTNVGSNFSPYDIFETNIRGTYTVLEACRTSPCSARAVVSSSKEVEDCFRPEGGRKYHPYMTSKASAELVTRTYADTFDIPVAVVRADNIYGGGDFNWRRLVPGTIRSVLRGEAPVIRSNGLFRRDYVYVEDAVDAYLAVGERMDSPDVIGRIFRLASGSGGTVLDMVSHIARIAGRSDLKPIVLNEQSYERVDEPYVPNFEKDVLGWSCKVDLEVGLSLTCDWYQKFFVGQSGY